MTTRKFSYAQNFEDIYISKIRKLLVQHYPNIHFPNTFIDIGAHHPHIDSVSKHFVDEGWTGLLVEPNPLYYSMLVKEYYQNEKIKVLDNIVTGKTDELRDIYIPERTTGHASLLKERVELLPEHYSSVAKVSKTLDDLIAFFDSAVFFVKLDVEGLEFEIISNCANLARVFLLVIESPTNQTINFLVQEEFALVFLDGLNGYFVPRTYCDTFKILPINVVEDFNWVAPSSWLSMANNEELLKLGEALKQLEENPAKANLSVRSPFTSIRGLFRWLQSFISDRSAGNT